MYDSSIPRILVASVSKDNTNNQEHEFRSGWGLGKVSSQISPQVNAHLKDGRLVLPKDLQRNLAGLTGCKSRHSGSWGQKCHSMSSPPLMTKNVLPKNREWHICLSLPLATGPSVKNGRTVFKSKDGYVLHPPNPRGVGLSAVTKLLPIILGTLPCTQLLHGPYKSQSL